MSIEQADFRLPATGEGWRKNTDDYPSLFTIIGMAHDVISGAPIVVYTHYEWSLAQLPPIFVCPLAEFIKVEPHARDDKQMVQKFSFEREAEDDPRCPFIRPAKVYEMTDG